VLGDSLARGTGDIAGKGYAVEVLEFVRRRGPASLANLAVAGFESDDVRRLVESANVRSLVAGADLLLVSIGGNDLSRALPRGGSPAGAAVEVTEARARFARNLRAILARLREANVRAPIYLLGLYDPFGEQRGPRVGASVIVGWNAVLQETAISFPGVWVVPTFDLFEKRADRLAADRFHPNRAGYEAIAARVAQLIPPEL
jgi:lysophospholipase L1-like esterase